MMFPITRLAARLKRPTSFIVRLEPGERRVDIIEFIAIARALQADPKTVFDSLL
jgi:hypothetical protein